MALNPPSSPTSVGLVEQLGLSPLGTQKTACDQEVGMLNLKTHLTPQAPEFSDIFPICAAQFLHHQCTPDQRPVYHPRENFILIYASFHMAAVGSKLF